VNAGAKFKQSEAFAMDQHYASDEILSVPGNRQSINDEITGVITGSKTIITSLYNYTPEEAVWQ